MVKLYCSNDQANLSKKNLNSLNNNKESQQEQSSPIEKAASVMKKIKTFESMLSSNASSTPPQPPPPPSSKVQPEREQSSFIKVISNDDSEMTLPIRNFKTRTSELINKQNNVKSKQQMIEMNRNYYPTDINVKRSINSRKSNVYTSNREIDYSLFRSDNQSVDSTLGSISGMSTRSMLSEAKAKLEAFSVKFSKHNNNNNSTSIYSTDFENFLQRKQQQRNDNINTKSSSNYEQVYGEGEEDEKEEERQKQVNVITNNNNNDINIIYDDNYFQTKF
jgi:hypothetical protein